MSHPNRTKTFVDPKVQGALVRRLVIHWVAFIAIAALVAFCLQVLGSPFQPLQEHVQQMWLTHGPFLVVLFFLLPVFIVDTIKLSHRFAGPIYRLRQTIRTMADGEPCQPLRFRDFDFWQGLAEDFNKMVNRLRNEDPNAAKHDANEAEAETPAPRLSIR